MDHRLHPVASAQQEGVAWMDSYFRTRMRWNRGRETAWKAITEYLQRWIPPSSTVLELGAGYCSFINHVRAAERHALDLYPEFSRFAAPGVRTHVCTCERMAPFSDRSIDIVFASNLLEHLSRESAAKTLSEVRRVLKMDGRLILVQPNFRYGFRSYFDDFTHLQVFTDKSLPDLLMSRGFDVFRIERRFLPMTFHSRWPTGPWIVKLYLRLPFRPFPGQMLVVASRGTDV